MLQRIRNQIGTAGLVVAIVALVAALGGGAYAATHPATASKAKPLTKAQVLALIKAFLRAGIMSEAGQIRDSVTGTPQGGLATLPTQWATSVSRCR